MYCRLLVLLACLALCFSHIVAAADATYTLRASNPASGSPRQHSHFSTQTDLPKARRLARDLPLHHQPSQPKQAASRRQPAATTPEHLRDLKQGLKLNRNRKPKTKAYNAMLAMHARSTAGRRGAIKV